MKGTEKQITWAEDIKATAINHCDNRINWEIEYRGSNETEDAILYRIYRAALTKAFEALDDAAKIIDKRNLYTTSTVDANVRQIKNLVAAGRMTIEQAAAKLGVTEY